VEFESAAQILDEWGLRRTVNTTKTPDTFKRVFGSTIFSEPGMIVVGARSGTQRVHFFDQVRLWFKDGGTEEDREKILSFSRLRSGRN